jgi:hypothetical protein
MNGTNQTNVSMLPISPGELLAQYWALITFCTLGTILHTFIIGLSLWPSKIQADFRWFVLNQAVNNVMVCASTVVIQVAFAFSNDRPFVGITNSIGQFLYTEALNDICFKGQMAQPFTVLVTSLNRFLAVAKPLQYKAIMTPKRIFFFCLLSYLVTIPTDERIWLFLGQLNQLIVTLILQAFYSIFALLLSFVLNIISYRRLTKHLKGTDSLAEKNRMRDSRSVVIASLLETIVPMTLQLPFFIYHIIYIYFLYTSGNIHIFFSVDSSLLYKIFHISETATYVTKFFVTPLCTGFVILFCIGPYRRLIMSWFKKKSITPAPAVA